jgi:2-polyprenyl-3-methyl-5-hydroxy-6-metoxy-1,4-benzoquinol methylase
MNRIDDMFIFEGEKSREKYHSKNPISKKLIQDFMRSLLALAELSGSSRFLEIGCGEGQICGILAKNGFAVKGFDISADSIAVARREAERHALDIHFFQKDLYEIDSKIDREQAVVCCEVLEHLKDVEGALNRIFSVAENRVILSVPHEPMWRFLNMLRGKYLTDWGNTPGHIQHWTKKEFVRLVSRHAKVLAVRLPTPWIMLLCEPKKM